MQEKFAVASKLLNLTLKLGCAKARSPLAPHWALQ